MSYSELSDEQKNQLRWELFLDNLCGGEKFGYENQWDYVDEITEDVMNEVFGTYSFVEDDFASSE